MLYTTIPLVMPVLMSWSFIKRPGGPVGLLMVTDPLVMVVVQLKVPPVTSVRRVIFTLAEEQMAFEFSGLVRWETGLTVIVHVAGVPWQ